MNRRIRYARPIHELIFSSWVTVPLALLLGAFVASQFFNLTPRYLKLGAGLLFLLAVTRLPLARSLALFSVIFVVPTFIFLADTNVLFLGLLMLVWLVQMTFGRASRPVRTPIDWAIWAYLGIHALSFINVESTFGLMNGLGVMQFLVAGIVFFVLLVNGIRTEEQLAGVLRALSITSGFIFVTALVEFFGKGYQLVPEWFLYRGGHSPATGGRIGGIFGFHGLLADYSAMMFYLHLTQARRATKTAHRVWYGTLCVLCLVMIALSVNRGGAAIWVLGGLYYMWLQRERLRFEQIALAVPVLVVGSLALEAITGKWLSRLTLFGRIANTQFQRGIPDTRIEAWTAILRKIPDHLWIGHGPFYDLKGGRGVVYWPHSAYLFYFYTTGFVGLLIFVWLIGKVIWISRPRGRVNFVRGSMASAAQAVLHLQVLMFAVAQIRDEHQRGNVYVYLMWMLFALAVVATRLVKQGPPQPADGGLEDVAEPFLRPRSASS